MPIFAMCVANIGKFTILYKAKSLYESSIFGVFLEEIFQCTFDTHSLRLAPIYMYMEIFLSLSQGLSVSFAELM